jgi:hypothetical protein
MCSFLVKEIKTYQEQKKIILYQKGNYEFISNYFEQINWENEFEKISVNEMHYLFLFHYNYAVETFIPIIRNPKA